MGMKDISDQVLTRESIEELVRLKSLYPHRKSAILMVLHVIHRQFGYIERKALIEASEIMELPLIDFDQAASFYTYFPRKKMGKYHIQVCRTLSCYLNGAEDLVTYLKGKLAIEKGGISADGLFSLVEVECLGSCGTGPMMQINEDYHERLTMARIDQIISALNQKAGNG